jgi:nucleotidyltransferase substrate binding protein (TIGR01987 family)
MGVSLDELDKAIASLEIAIQLLEKSNLPEDTDEIKVIRDGCIQRFEYCIELSWKASIKLLGSQAQAANPAIREMARNNLIDKPIQWFGVIEARNETSHSYNENIAKKVFEQIKLFVPEVNKLIIELRKLL